MSASPAVPPSRSGEPGGRGEAEVRSGGRSASPAVPVPGFRGSLDSLDASIAFEEGKARRVEQPPLAGDEGQVAVPATAVDQPEQRQQLRPSPEALVHGVRVRGRIGAQPGEQAAEGVVLLVHRVVGHHAAVLGVEEEHQPHQHDDQPAVEVARRFARQRRQGAVACVRRHEPAQQLVQRGQHLAREPRRDLGLRLAAPGEQRGQSRVLLAHEHRMGREQHVERGQDGAARGHRHLREVEGQVAGRLPAGGVDQPDAVVGAEQAGGNAGFRQQPDEAFVPARVPRRILGRGVEVRAVGLHADEHRPAGGGVGGRVGGRAGGCAAIRIGVRAATCADFLAVVCTATRVSVRAAARTAVCAGARAAVRTAIRRDRPGRRQHRLQLRQRDLEPLAVGVGIGEIGLVPAEPVEEHAPEVGRAPAGRRAGVVPFEQRGELALPAGDVAVGHHLRVHHHRGRDDEAHRLHEAQPLLVGEDQAAAFAVGHRSRL